ncbi:MAG: hypothetical protein ACPIOQ_42640 [Promethearchaeia archaeon]
MEDYRLAQKMGSGGQGQTHQVRQHCGPACVLPVRARDGLSGSVTRQLF